MDGVAEGVVGFGRGKWVPRWKASGARDAFGVCAVSQHGWATADRICISQRVKDGPVSSVALMMLPGGDEKRVPLDVREVRFAFTGANWDKEDDGCFGDFAAMPSGDGAILVCHDVSEFEAVLRGSLDETQGREWHMRISVFGVESWSRQSNHFSFFHLNGFIQAWRALGAYRDDGFMLLDGWGEG